MKQERLLILVKTYPTLSTKYGETVCTAAMRDDGSWVRLYPVPFRRLGETEQYRKYDWLECRIVRNTQDRRPESYRPADESELQAVAHIGTQDQWHERRQLVLGKAKVSDKLDELILGAKQNEISLAVFKPAKVIDFIVEKEESRDWDPKKLSAMRAHIDQLSLFDDNEWRKTFRVIPKLPYKFSYRFDDANGQRSQLQILDWEIGALFWNCLWRDQRQNEQVAIEKVRAKYFDEFVGKDLHFFLGTTLQFHSISPNPWLIIGVFPAPYQTQLSLLF
jgi:hypothetical protein